MLSHLTHAPSQGSIAALGLSVATIQLGRGVFVCCDVRCDFAVSYFDHIRYSGVCDKDGCDFNPYRMGVTNFFGVGSSFSIDTSKVWLESALLFPLTF